MLNNRYVKIALVVGTLTALLLAVYAYAASTDIADGGKVGYGVETLEGYTVAAYSFTQAANPIYLLSWTVTLNTAASAVKARVGEDSTTASVWVTCTTANNTLWTCVPVADHVLLTDANNLQVSAVTSVP